jgi:hypothetical protein
VVELLPCKREALNSILSTNKQKKNGSSQALVLTPITPVTWEAEIRRIMV